MKIETLVSEKNIEWFIVTNRIELINHTLLSKNFSIFLKIKLLTLPIDLEKKRIQISLEVKRLTGIGFRRWLHTIDIFNK